jgi:hypothetical protein
VRRRRSLGFDNSVAGTASIGRHFLGFIVSDALTHGDLRLRLGKPDQRLFVIKPDQQFAGKYLVVGCHQHARYPAGNQRR